MKGYMHACMACHLFKIIVSDWMMVNSKMCKVYKTQTHNKTLVSNGLDSDDENDSDNDTLGYLRIEMDGKGNKMDY